MNDNPDAPKVHQPASQEELYSAEGFLSFAGRALRYSLIPLLLVIGILAGISAADGEGGSYSNPRPGTGAFAAGCVIAAAILISRKPN